MKYQPTRLTLLAVFLVLMQGCASAPKTISNVAPDADFGRYSSFGFLDVLSTDKESYESMESNFLKVAVAQELALMTPEGRVGDDHHAGAG